jgi:uncharacterized membrane protein
MRSFLYKLRRYFVTGLIVIAPVGVTAFVLFWLFQRLDPIIGRYLPAVEGRQVPGLGLLALIVIVTAVGWASQIAAGRRLLHWWNIGLARLPFARRIYSASAQIVESVLEREEKLFQHCSLIEFPGPGMWALAFETAETPEPIEGLIGEPAVNVFLPTAPNPTSGYLLVVPRRSVRRLDLSVEDGLKLVLSVGVAAPGVIAGRSSK